MSGANVCNEFDFVNLIKADRCEDVASALASGAMAADAALLLAAELGAERCVAAILSAGACVNACNARLESASHLAADREHGAVVRLLAARGADLAQKDNLEQTVLDICARRLQDAEDEGTVIALIERGAPLDNGDTLTRLAGASVACFHALHRRHVRFDALRDRDGGSPCLVAAERSGDPALLDLLVRVGGVDANASDADGVTSLHLCAFSGHVDVLRWLVNAGANVRAATVFGQTPLITACIGRHVECVLLLLAAGCDVDAVDNFGRSACHAAIRTGALLIAHALIAAGCDLDARHNDGSTLRQLAARSNVWMPTEQQLDSARRRVARLQLDFVRQRALQVCIGLQSRGLDALQMCELLQYSCGPVAALVPWHRWWTIATTVKHFRKQ
jgi:ankyrin repeat protein